MTSAHPRLMTATKIVLGITILMMSAGAASAQTDTVDVSATVVAAAPTCSTGIQSVDYGNIDAGDVTSLGDYDDNFNMNFNCTGSITGATATFDGGLNPNSSATVRQMTGPGGATILYTLNEPPSLAITIGETLTFNLPSGISSIPLVGRVSSQTITSTLGAFSDTVTVTFTF